jgi:hypothetical protein
MPKFNKRRSAICAALAFAGATCAQADNGISTTISGYGTVGGTMTSDNNYAYIHDPTEFGGAAHQLNVGLESRLGVQAVIDFGSGFSVIAQEVARQRGDSAFSLGTEWLFLQYVPISDVKLRLGRVALPTFLLSDSRNVGYAAPWFRAPNELYGSGPFHSLDGVQALWHHNVGAIGLGLEGAYGNTQVQYRASGIVSDVKTTGAYNVAATVEYGDFLFRVARTSLNIPTTIPLGPSFAVNYVIKDIFDTAGLQYDNGKAIVLSEFGKRTENDIPILGEPALASKEWYVAGGWRFGKWTPMLIFGVYSAGTSIIEPEGKTGTWSVSLRYDVARNVALKAQISRPQAANFTYWADPNYTSTERVSVYSLGADFLF